MKANPKELFQKLKQRLRIAGTLERILWVLVLLPFLPILFVVLVAKGLKKRRLRKLRKGQMFVQNTAAAPQPVVDPTAEAAIRQRPSDYAFIRIIGNDLPPRHQTGQSLKNVQFILENEPDFPNCEKLWLLNRIRNQDDEVAIVQALEAAGHEYIKIPFSLDEYAAAPLDFSLFPSHQYIFGREFHDLDLPAQDRGITSIYRHRNNYAMNNNGARNAALEWGRSRAKWVLPWDGNCFVTGEDWDRFVSDIASQEDHRYFVVPMVRLASNDVALDRMDPDDATEEPQIAFRCDAGEMFDGSFPYGRRPKVELLVRLGVEGPWRWNKLDPWDLKANKPVPDSHLIGKAGMVRRLDSGRNDLEIGGKEGREERAFARNDAIVDVLRVLDKEVLDTRGYDPKRPVFFGRETLEHLGAGKTSIQTQQVRHAANEALGRGPFSVFDKTELPPSGNKADYFHPAPYWWPNPKTKDGLPYVKRDGERLPGTVLYAPESKAYDRTRLQFLFDDAVSCGLAWAVFGDNKYRDHAKRLVETWFLEEESAMTPHLRYAQLRRGHDNDEGAKSGIIEFKDIAYLLDAVRLIDDPALTDQLADWLRHYRDWLVSSEQGQGERRALNNHGVFFDLQLASIAAFLGDADTLLDCYFASTGRLTGHFEEDGRQPHELKRSMTEHYCAFNLHGWLSLYMLYKSCGFPVEHQPEFARVGQGATWFLGHRDAPWPYEQISEFDDDRYAAVVLFASALDLGVSTEPRDLNLATQKPLFHPHDGVPPFWSLMVAPDTSDAELNLEAEDA
ncbi:alginate lyase family protein [Litoreibacter roseus]|uniref:Alginate lyase domain-containing protein n=1 Tax=Litoreibacter roseus TaxID=2601869 RepID=A0A6N6JJB1_9RHOB|nr:alginate lyase family protein [Litoreibacter roseus]GFE66224.1 hypothetical protein KIN_32980 [Litoreibacter roseus]